MGNEKRILERNNCIGLVILFPAMFICVGIVLWLLLYVLTGGSNVR
jgi:hypothetical protein